MEFSNDEKDALSLESILEIENYLDNYVFDREDRERFNEIWKFLNLNNKYLDKNSRMKIFSLFWNNFEYFSNLFSSLTKELENLQNNKMLDLEESALIPRETSIIDVDLKKKL